MKFSNLKLGQSLTGFAAVVAVAASGLGFSGSALAQQSLQELLNETRSARAAEKRENDRRVSEFVRNRNEQKKLFDQARRELAALNRRASQLSSAFDANEAKLSELETTLDSRSGALGEMFGVVRQFSGDMFSTARNSMVTPQVGRDRLDFLSDLSGTKRLPSIEKLEGLWEQMLLEIIESGRVVKFDATVVDTDGESSDKEIVRIGNFTAVTDGKYLLYPPGEQNPQNRFRTLTEQPSGLLTSAAGDFYSANSGYQKMYLDPSAGVLLAAEARKRNLVERVEENEAGAVGWVIIALTVLGLLLALLKFIQLTLVSGKISAQKRKPGDPKDSNPLGRVMNAYYKDPTSDTETLELRLDEAVLKETPAIERGLGGIKILAAVGPLLGLLGTVTGMIEVFQQITLFGTGDPKQMAGGISQALMTTVLGLVMAIPLVLLHALLAARGKGIIQTLDEQAVGLIAEHNETPAQAANSEA